VNEASDKNNCGGCGKVCGGSQACSNSQCISNCTYPGGGYGVTAGATVSPNVAFNLYAPGAGSPTLISIKNFFDCDGSKGINALLVVYGGTWCSVCQSKAAALPGEMQTWGPAGVYVLEVLHDCNGAGDALNWRNQFGLNVPKVYTGWDNDFQFKSGAYTSDPFRVLINPRNMQIVKTFTESSGTDDEAYNLALQNQ